MLFTVTLLLHLFRMVIYCYTAVSHILYGNYMWALSIHALRDADTSVECWQECGLKAADCELYNDIPVGMFY